MDVRIRLFAMQRELAGTRELRLELPDRGTVEDAWAAVVERHPVLAPGRSSVRFARNGEYVDADVVLEDHDELAFIPPVSGGDDGERQRILEIRDAPFDATIHRADARDAGHTGSGPGGRGGSPCQPSGRGS
jgi:molybdopterin converting factor subunit 1